MTSRHGGFPLGPVLAALARADKADDSNDDASEPQDAPRVVCVCIFDGPLDDGALPDENIGGATKSDVAQSWTQLVQAILDNLPQATRVVGRS